jgi:hypothetical protein
VPSDLLRGLSVRFSNKEVQGTKFMDMLCSIVDNINSPEMIYAKIGDLGGMHYRLGVRAAHMVTSTLCPTQP